MPKIIIYATHNAAVAEMVSINHIPEFPRQIEETSSGTPFLGALPLEEALIANQQLLPSWNCFINLHAVLVAATASSSPNPAWFPKI